ncbi:MAG: HAD hydrolase-like protein [Fibrobacteria bacterium]|nr:HAD hydrolase-like protein [Fibrobacteria bacterium]
MTFRLLVYDLDGTLVESLLDLHATVNLSLAEHGFPARSVEQVRRAIGDGARLLLQRSLPDGIDPSQVDAVWASFRGHYVTECTRRTTLIRGAESFLAARAEESSPPVQTILTNKPQKPTDVIVRHFGLDRWVSRAIGGDTVLGKKPDPLALRELMREAGATPETTLMIGDGPADLEVAQAAGVRSILLSTGYGKREELDGLPRWREVDDLEHLASIWEELVRSA